MSSTNIQIAVKVRPLLEREKREKLTPLWLVKENSIVQVDSVHSFVGEPYSFDHIFDDSKSNKDVYDTVVKPLVMSCLEGINSTIFAYGQTSSGKTHTMSGGKNIPGIVDFTVKDVFTHIEENTTKNFLLRCSYLEIYNEKINDLLDTKAKDVKIREDCDQGVYVAVKEEVIREPEELIILMKKGMKTRKIGCTDMNERSSRSHTIFKLIIQSQNKDSEGSYTESTLNLVDLAGSERVGQMNMGRERQVEGVSINKSLTTLGLVIRKLSENEQFINYRDSKLTRLLQHSLGGNSKTLIITTVTVAVSEETKTTLDFAQRAKYVKNRPIKNEKVTDKDQLKKYVDLCEEYMEKIEKLKLEKVERDRTINSLEDKISNIELFSTGNLKQTSKPNRIPNRRHTLAHYKPQQLKFSFMDPGDIECDNEDLASSCFRFTTAEDKENSFCSDYVFSSPTTSVVSKSPISTIKLEKELLEESYSNLRSFTNLEKQLQGKSDQLKEFSELAERLRNENAKIEEEILQRDRTNKEIYSKLILLKSILDVKPFEEMRRKSLDTIFEEDLSSSILDDADELDQTPKKWAAMIEENQRLKVKALTCTRLEEENQRFKTLIQDLKATIREDKDVKEAELEILNNKIKKLNNYKEEMHEQISELRKSQKIGESQSLKLRESTLQHSVTETELDRLKEENESLVSELKSLTDTNKENERLKSDLEEALFQLSGEQKEMETCYQKLEEKERRIEALNKTISVLKNDLEKLKNINSPLRANELIETSQEAIEEHIQILQTQIVTLENRLSFKELNLNAVKVENDTNLGKIEDLEKEKSDLMQLLSNTTSKLENYAKDIGILQKICDEQKTAIDRLGHQLNIKTDAYNQLLSDYDIKTKEYKQQLNKSEVLDKEKRDLEQKAEIYIQNIRILQETSDEQETAIDQLKIKTDSYDQLMLDYDSKTREYDQQLQKIQDIEKEKIYLERRAESYAIDIQTLHTISDEQKTAVNKLRHQLKIKTDSYDQLLSDYDIKTREYDQQLQKIEKEKGDLEQRAESYVGHAKDIQILHATSDEQKSVINKLRHELKVKTDSYDQLLFDYDSKTRKYDQQLQKIEKEKGDLEQRAGSYVKDIQILQATYDEQKTTISELGHQLNNNSNLRKYDQQLKKVEVLKKENRDLQEKAETYISDVIDLQATARGQVQTINGLQSQLDDKTKSYNVLLAENECLTKENSKLTKQLSKLEECMDKSRVDVDEKLEGQNEELCTRLRQLEKTFLDTERQLKERCKEYIQLKSKYNALEIQLFNCKKDFSTKSRELDEARRDAKSKTLELTKAREEIQKMEIERKFERENKVVSLDEIFKENKKTPVRRLSGEGVFLSPSELRRNKRHSIHDQRRKLTGSQENLEKDYSVGSSPWASPPQQFQNGTISGCSDCNKLRTRFSALEVEIDELKKDNKFFDSENAALLQIIREKERNESHLYEQLEKSAANETSSRLHKEDKGTQATCGLQEKYNKLQKIAILRRKESNHLRAALNLPPDCPLLPNDLKRSKSDS